MSTGRLQSRWAACLALLLVASLALALPAAGEAAGPGGIKGTVTGEGGVPLTGVDVCAFGTGPTEEEGECALSAAGGSYEIDGLPEGTYKVAFFGSSQNYVQQYYDGALTWSTATPVSVAGGEVRSGIDAELEHGATIGGRVTAAATGLPVAGVLVCAESTDEVTFECAETNGSGAYVVNGLTPGLYEVEFWTGEIEGDLLSQFYPGLVPVAARQAVPEINAALQAGGQISGTVRAAATGAPLAGVEVCVTEANFTWSDGCLKTPPSGRYRFFGFPTGTYKIVFSPEANEIENSKFFELPADAFPTQWWSGQVSFTTATPILVTAPAVVENIDGSLGPGPVVAPQPAPQTPPATAVVKPKRKPLRCHKGQIKRKLKGKALCVKRLTPKRHHRKHHPKPRKHAKHSR